VMMPEAQRSYGKLPAVVAAELFAVITEFPPERRSMAFIVPSL
jgi:hypothetical protein